MVAISIFTQRYVLSILYSVLATLVFNYFFTAPYFAFEIDNISYIITFVMMVTVSLIITMLTQRIKTNAAIANLLKYHGTIANDIERVLMFYFRMCSVEMSCRELARAFMAFTNRQPFDYAGYKLSTSRIKRLNAVMQTCGFYDEAGEFSYLVGLPGKSGVGGGIVAIYPMRYSVAVWSPRLNSKGNSIMGMKALELLTTATQESIF